MSQFTTRDHHFDLEKLTEHKVFGVSQISAIVFDWILWVVRDPAIIAFNRLNNPIAKVIVTSTCA